jgi:uncharacterized protein YjgD (DUF1641 family)
VELTMTITEVMDLQVPADGQAEILAELRALNEKMDRVERVIDRVTHRMEDLEEMGSDLWPMVHGVTQAISRKLHELEQAGTLEDARHLGNSVGHLLHTARHLTQPGVLDVADRAAAALEATTASQQKQIGLWQAMRDPEIRRGMTLMLGVLREMGREGTTKNGTAFAVEAAQQGEHP